MAQSIKAVCGLVILVSIVLGGVASTPEKVAVLEATPERQTYWRLGDPELETTPI